MEEEALKNFFEIEKYFNILKNFCGKILVIEGNIAVGKSTFVKSLLNLVEYFNRHRKSFYERSLQDCGFKPAEEFKIKVFRENVPKKFLELYLKDKKRYAYGFQTIMAQERIRIHKEAKKAAEEGYFCIIDRGIRGDGAFAYMQKEQNVISQREYEAYLEIVQNAVISEPDFVIYLTCTAEKAYKRVCDRGDPSEIESYNIEYLQSVINAHDKMIPHYTGKILKQEWENDLRLSSENFIPREKILEVLELLNR